MGLRYAVKSVVALITGIWSRVGIDMIKRDTPKIAFDGWVIGDRLKPKE